LPYVLNVIAENARDLAHEFRELGRAVWLSEDRAFDIPLANEPNAALLHDQATAISATADINLVSADRRRKKLLVADMDSTVIGCECLNEIAKMAGLGPRVAAITERAMRGEIAFEPALRDRVALLKGLPIAILERVCRERVCLDSGAKALVATMRAHGAHTILVSGGFSWFAERVARDAGFNAWQANILVDDGVELTGEVAEPVLGRDAKLAALEKAAALRGIGLQDTLAVGDGANDLAVIGRAGLGVAYRAKPIVASAARARITHSDLSALLYLQGYRDDEICGGSLAR